MHSSNYPADTVAILASLRAHGLNADAIPTGGGCMAVTASIPPGTDPLGPHAMVTNGDAWMPDGTDLWACVYTFEHTDYAEPAETVRETVDAGPLTATQADTLAADIRAALERAEAVHAAATGRA